MKPSKAEKINATAPEHHHAKIAIGQFIETL